jgi:type VI secretion system protein ImpA
LDVVQDVARDKLKKALAKDEAAVSEGPAGTGAGPGGTNNTIRTRDDAFHQLLKVADFFQRTEPHSPVSFALEQVVRWGRMPLPELLAELIPEEGPRKSLFQRVGIRPPEPPKSAEPAKK